MIHAPMPADPCRPCPGGLDLAGRLAEPLPPARLAGGPLALVLSLAGALLVTGALLIGGR